MLAFCLDAAALNELHDAGRGAGDEAAVVFLAQLADVDGVKAVHVFAGQDAIKGFSFVDVVWQWCLDQNAADVGVCVQCVDLSKQVFLADVLGEDVHAAADADAGSGFLLLADIGNRCGILADTDDGDDWFLAWKGADFLSQFFNDGFCDSVAVDELHGWFVCQRFVLGIGVNGEGLFGDADGASLNYKILAAGHDWSDFTDDLDVFREEWS